MDTAPLSAQDRLYVSGHHFFANAATPTFDLRSEIYGDALGVVYTTKNASSRASGEGNVPWLQLMGMGGSQVKEVYRLNTVGGAAPQTCGGLEGEFDVIYAAEYWFFG